MEKEPLKNENVKAKEVPLKAFKHQEFTERMAWHGPRIRGKLSL